MSTRLVFVSILHGYGHLTTRKEKGLYINFESDSLRSHALPEWQFLAVGDLTSRYFSGPRFVIEVAEGFSGHDDKRRHRAFQRAFRTLSLASPPAFIDPALVPGDLDAVKPVARGSRGCPSFVVRCGRRRGNFQLKATIYCSKSRVFNCMIWERVGQPATARGSGGSVGAKTGGLMQRKGVGVSTSIRWRHTLAVFRALTIVMMACLLLLGWVAMTSAQVNTATLSGTVSDPQGLPVKGAKITMTNGATGAPRTSVTDDSGRYNLVGLPPGQYKMEIGRASCREIV